MNAKAVSAIIFVMVGCILNNVFLEYIIKLDAGAGHLITFSQFLFVAIHGFIFTSKFGTVTPKIAFKHYMTLVIFFYMTSVINNWVFDFNVPVPLHMIFRAGSLIANMIMGIFLLSKKYTWQKYLSVFMITVGIIICTLYSSGEAAKSCENCSAGSNKGEGSESTEVHIDQLFWWIIGLVLLTFALLLSARMGIYQETLYKEHGKHPQEALYYTHLYSLPGFIFNALSIWEHSVIATKSEPFIIPFTTIVVPIIWWYIVANVLTQYLCISSVYVLTTECSSLTVTLVITLRKFLSLIFSIVYFKNPFTPAHWLGTILVFGGTLLFAEIPARVSNAIKRVKEKERTD
ncbi:UDP-xylose and UDP-N-acetylglucosamine transporter-like [Cylas formicarius]|uniref:UDP-xylose and UDP-N-acetylglucosamine transporter-like n=1 Tax=Cylas formicarius TaxID=197179 RepID=UPI002958BA3E|nr:UDP-xylose and UDP-N-acetylglucosamine transporter-like [Cylas formicarius]